MINIGDASVLDCTEITTDEMCKILGIKSRSSLFDAINSQKIPQPYDKLGPGGSSRWFVGQLRAWWMHDCQRAIARATKKLDATSSVAELSSEKQNNPRSEFIGTGIFLLSQCGTNWGTKSRISPDSPVSQGPDGMRTSCRPRRRPCRRPWQRPGRRRGPSSSG